MKDSGNRFSLDFTQRARETHRLSGARGAFEPACGAIIHFERQAGVAAPPL